MENKLQIALISGPAYDKLYQSMPVFTEKTGIEVSVGFSGDHPALNHHLAGLSEVPYDLVSTHTKYAPSQLEFLSPLNGALGDEVLEDFAPRLLELATINDSLYGLPRNIDVRLLHYQTDIIPAPPKSWEELSDLALKLNSAPEFYGFVFPGKESGLFGTFYELCEMGGAKLFPENLIPDIENEGGRWALNLLVKLYKEESLPESFTSWHFEEVHELFRSGRAAMVGDFPGYYKYYLDETISSVANRFGIVPYPLGPAGTTRTYGGGHTFALTKKGIRNPQALALLLFLTGYDQQLLEAENGCVPVRKSVLRKMKNTASEADLARLEILEKVIAEQILIPPKVTFFPKIEDILWTTVQRAIIGQSTVDEALKEITEKIKQVVTDENSLKKNADTNVKSAFEYNLHI